MTSEVLHWSYSGINDKVVRLFTQECQHSGDLELLRGGISLHTGTDGFGEGCVAWLFFEDAILISLYKCIYF